uniref:Genome polyprotein n=1 Tax=Atrato Flavi-like virus 1 TaxID=2689355 RepID=A0A6B9KG91_9FLAV|nr:polyprotein [Atrato Flavi-like virus 1]
MFKILISCSTTDLATTDMSTPIMFGRVRPCRYEVGGSLWARMCRTFGSFRPEAGFLRRLHEDEMALEGLSEEAFQQAQEALFKRYSYEIRENWFSWRESAASRKAVKIAEAAASEKKGPADKQVRKFAALVAIDGVRAHLEEMAAAGVTRGAINRWVNTHPGAYKGAKKALKESRHQQAAKESFSKKLGQWNRENRFPKEVALQAHTAAGKPEKTFRFVNYVGQLSGADSHRARFARCYAQASGTTYEAGTAAFDQQFKDLATAKFEARRAYKARKAAKEAARQGHISRAQAKEAAFQKRQADFEVRRAAYLARVERRQENDGLFGTKQLFHREEFLVRRNEWLVRREANQKARAARIASRPPPRPRHTVPLVAIWSFRPDDKEVSQKTYEAVRTRVLKKRAGPVQIKLDCETVVGNDSGIESDVESPEVPEGAVFTALPEKSADKEVEADLTGLTDLINAPVYMSGQRMYYRGDAQVLGFNGVAMCRCFNCEERFPCASLYRTQCVTDCYSCGPKIAARMQTLGLEKLKVKVAKSPLLRKGEFGLDKPKRVKTFFNKNDMLCYVGGEPCIKLADNYHRHVCVNCGKAYEHIHSYKSEKHAQFVGDCPHCRPDEITLQKQGVFKTSWNSRPATKVPVKEVSATPVKVVKEAPVELKPMPVPPKGGRIQVTPHNLQHGVPKPQRTPAERLVRSRPSTLSEVEVSCWTATDNPPTLVAENAEYVSRENNGVTEYGVIQAGKAGCTAVHLHLPTPQGARIVGDVAYWGMVASNVPDTVEVNGKRYKVRGGHIKSDDLLISGMQISTLQGDFVSVITTKRGNNYLVQSVLPTSTVTRSSSGGYGGFWATVGVMFLVGACIHQARGASTPAAAPRRLYYASGGTAPFSLTSKTCTISIDHRDNFISCMTEKADMKLCSRLNECGFPETKVTDCQGAADRDQCFLDVVGTFVPRVLTNGFNVKLDVAGTVFTYSGTNTPTDNCPASKGHGDNSVYEGSMGFCILHSCAKLTKKDRAVVTITDDCKCYFSSLSRVINGFKQDFDRDVRGCKKSWAPALKYSSKSDNLYSEFAKFELDISSHTAAIKELSSAVIDNDEKIRLILQESESLGTVSTKVLPVASGAEAVVQDILMNKMTIKHGKEIGLSMGAGYATANQLQTIMADLLTRAETLKATQAQLSVLRTDLTDAKNLATKYYQLLTQVNSTRKDLERCVALIKIQGKSLVDISKNIRSINTLTGEIQGKINKLGELMMRDAEDSEIDVSLLTGEEVRRKSHEAVINMQMASASIDRLLAGIPADKGGEAIKANILAAEREVNSLADPMDNKELAWKTSDIFKMPEISGLGNTTLQWVGPVGQIHRANCDNKKCQLLKVAKAYPTTIKEMGENRGSYCYFCDGIDNLCLCTGFSTGFYAGACDYGSVQCLAKDFSEVMKLPRMWDISGYSSLNDTQCRKNKQDNDITVGAIILRASCYINKQAVAPIKIVSKPVPFGIPLTKFITVFVVIATAILFVDKFGAIAGIAVILIASGASVYAECDVDAVQYHMQATSKEGDVDVYEVDLNVQPGTCITFGSDTFSVKEITKTSAFRPIGLCYEHITVDKVESNHGCPWGADIECSYYKYVTSTNGRYCKTSCTQQDFTERAGCWGIGDATTDTYACFLMTEQFTMLEKGDLLEKAIHIKVKNTVGEHSLTVTEGADYNNEQAGVSISKVVIEDSTEYQRAAVSQKRSLGFKSTSAADKVTLFNPNGTPQDETRPVATAEVASEFISWNLHAVMLDGIPKDASENIPADNIIVAWNSDSSANSAKISTPVHIARLSITYRTKSTSTFVSDCGDKPRLQSVLGGIGDYFQGSTLVFTANKACKAKLSCGPCTVVGSPYAMISNIKTNFTVVCGLFIASQCSLTTRMNDKIVSFDYPVAGLARNLNYTWHTAIVGNWGVANSTISFMNQVSAFGSSIGEVFSNILPTNIFQFIYKYSLVVGLILLALLCFEAGLTVPGLALLSAAIVGAALASEYPGYGKFYEGICIQGVWTPGRFFGRVNCSHECHRHWSHKDPNCVQPRRHIIACRFSGPEWGINCWNNNQSVENFWDAMEEAISTILPVTVDINTHDLTYSWEKDGVVYFHQFEQQVNNFSPMIFDYKQVCLFLVAALMVSLSEPFNWLIVVTPACAIVATIFQKVIGRLNNKKRAENSRGILQNVFAKTAFYFFLSLLVVEKSWNLLAEWSPSLATLCIIVNMQWIVPSVLPMIKCSFLGGNAIKRYISSDYETVLSRVDYMIDTILITSCILAGSIEAALVVYFCKDSIGMLRAVRDYLRNNSFTSMGNNHWFLSHRIAKVWWKKIDLNTRDRKFKQTLANEEQSMIVNEFDEISALVPAMPDVTSNIQHNMNNGEYVFHYYHDCVVYCSHDDDNGDSRYKIGHLYVDGESKELVGGLLKASDKTRSGDLILEDLVFPSITIKGVTLYEDRKDFFAPGMSGMHGYCTRGEYFHGGVIKYNGSTYAFDARDADAIKDMEFNGSIHYHRKPTIAHLAKIARTHADVINKIWIIEDNLFVGSIIQKTFITALHNVRGPKRGVIITGGLIIIGQGRERIYNMIKNMPLDGDLIFGRYLLERVPCGESSMYKDPRGLLSQGMSGMVLPTTTGKVYFHCGILEDDECNLAIDARVEDLIEGVIHHGDEESKSGFSLPNTIKTMVFKPSTSKVSPTVVVSPSTSAAALENMTVQLTDNTKVVRGRIQQRPKTRERSRSVSVSNRKLIPATSVDEAAQMVRQLAISNTANPRIRKLNVLGEVTEKVFETKRGLVSQGGGFLTKSNFEKVDAPTLTAQEERLKNAVKRKAAYNLARNRGLFYGPIDAIMSKYTKKYAYWDSSNNTLKLTTANILEQTVYKLVKEEDRASCIKELINKANQIASSDRLFKPKDITVSEREIFCFVARVSDLKRGVAASNSKKILDGEKPTTQVAMVEGRNSVVRGSYAKDGFVMSEGTTRKTVARKMIKHILSGPNLRWLVKHKADIALIRDRITIASSARIMSFFLAGKANGAFATTNVHEMNLFMLESKDEVDIPRYMVEDLPTERKEFTTIYHKTTFTKAEIGHLLLHRPHSCIFYAELDIPIGDWRHISIKTMLSGGDQAIDKFDKWYASYQKSIDDNNIPLCIDYFEHHNTDKVFCINAASFLAMDCHYYKDILSFYESSPGEELIPVHMAQREDHTIFLDKIRSLIKASKELETIPEAPEEAPKEDDQGSLKSFKMSEDGEVDVVDPNEIREMGEELSVIEMPIPEQEKLLPSPICGLYFNARGLEFLKDLIKIYQLNNYGINAMLELEIPTKNQEVLSDVHPGHWLLHEKNLRYLRFQYPRPGYCYAYDGNIVAPYHVVSRGSIVIPYYGCSSNLISPLKKIAGAGACEEFSIRLKNSQAITNTADDQVVWQLGDRECEGRLVVGDVVVCIDPYKRCWMVGICTGKNQSVSTTLTKQNMILPIDISLGIDFLRPIVNLDYMKATSGAPWLDRDGRPVGVLSNACSTKHNGKVVPVFHTNAAVALSGSVNMDMQAEILLQEILHQEDGEVLAVTAPTGFGKSTQLILAMARSIVLSKKEGVDAIENIWVSTPNRLPATRNKAYVEQLVASQNESDHIKVFLRIKGQSDGSITRSPGVVNIIYCSAGHLLMSLHNISKDKDIIIMDEGHERGHYPMLALEAILLEKKYKLWCYMTATPWNSVDCPYELKVYSIEDTSGRKEATVKLISPAQAMTSEYYFIEYNEKAYPIPKHELSGEGRALIFLPTISACEKSCKKWNERYSADIIGTQLHRDKPELPSETRTVTFTTDYCRSGVTYPDCRLVFDCGEVNRPSLRITYGEDGKIDIEYQIRIKPATEQDQKQAAGRTNRDREGVIYAAADVKPVPMEAYPETAKTQAALWMLTTSNYDWVFKTHQEGDNPIITEAINHYKELTEYRRLTRRLPVKERGRDDDGARALAMFTLHRKLGSYCMSDNLVVWLCTPGALPNYAKDKQYFEQCDKYEEMLRNYMRLGPREFEIHQIEQAGISCTDLSKMWRPQEKQVLFQITPAANISRFTITGAAAVALALTGAGVLAGQLYDEVVGDRVVHKHYLLNGDLLSVLNGLSYVDNKMAGKSYGTWYNQLWNRIERVMKMAVRKIVSSFCRLDGNKVERNWILKWAFRDSYTDYSEVAKAWFYDRFGGLLSGDVSMPKFTPDNLTSLLDGSVVVGIAGTIGHLYDSMYRVFGALVSNAIIVAITQQALVRLPVYAGLLGILTTGLTYFAKHANDGDFEYSNRKGHGGLLCAAMGIGYVLSGRTFDLLGGLGSTWNLTNNINQNVRFDVIAQNMISGYGQASNGFLIAQNLINFIETASWSQSNIYAFICQGISVYAGYAHSPLGWRGLMSAAVTAAAYIAVKVARKNVRQVRRSVTLLVNTRNPNQYDSINTDTQRTEASKLEQIERMYSLAVMCVGAITNPGAIPGTAMQVVGLYFSSERAALVGGDELSSYLKHAQLTMCLHPALSFIVGSIQLYHTIKGNMSANLENARFTDGLDNTTSEVGFSVIETLRTWSTWLSSTLNSIFIDNPFCEGMGRFGLICWEGLVRGAQWIWSVVKGLGEALVSAFTKMGESFGAGIVSGVWKAIPGSSWIDRLSNYLKSSRVDLEESPELTEDVIQTRIKEIQSLLFDRSGRFKEWISDVLHWCGINTSAWIRKANNGWKDHPIYAAITAESVREIILPDSCKMNGQTFLGFNRYHGPWHRLPNTQCKSIGAVLRLMQDHKCRGMSLETRDATKVFCALTAQISKDVFLTGTVGAELFVSAEEQGLGSAGYFRSSRREELSFFYYIGKNYGFALFGQPNSTQAYIVSYGLSFDLLDIFPVRENRIAKLVGFHQKQKNWTIKKPIRLPYAHPTWVEFAAELFELTNKDDLSITACENIAKVILTYSPFDAIMDKIGSYKLQRQMILNMTGRPEYLLIGNLPRPIDIDLDFLAPPIAVKAGKPPVGNEVFENFLVLETPESRALKAISWNCAGNYALAARVLSISHGVDVYYNSAGEDESDEWFVVSESAHACACRWVIMTDSLRWFTTDCANPDCTSLYMNWCSSSTTFRSLMLKSLSEKTDEIRSYLGPDVKSASIVTLDLSNYLIKDRRGVIKRGTFYPFKQKCKYDKGHFITMTYNGRRANMGPHTLWGLCGTLDISPNPDLCTVSSCVDLNKKSVQELFAFLDANIQDDGHWVVANSTVLTVWRVNAVIASLVDGFSAGDKTWIIQKIGEGPITSTTNGVVVARQYQCATLCEELENICRYNHDDFPNKQLFYRLIQELIVRGNHLPFQAAVTALNNGGSFSNLLRVAFDLKQAKEFSHYDDAIISGDCPTHLTWRGKNYSWEELDKLRNKLCKRGDFLPAFVSPKDSICDNPANDPNINLALRSALDNKESDDKAKANAPSISGAFCKPMGPKTTVKKELFNFCKEAVTPQVDVHGKVLDASMQVKTATQKAKTAIKKAFSKKGSSKGHEPVKREEVESILYRPGTSKLEGLPDGDLVHKLSSSCEEMSSSDVDYVECRLMSEGKKENFGSSQSFSPSMLGWLGCKLGEIVSGHDGNVPYTRIAAVEASNNSILRREGFKIVRSDFVTNVAKKDSELAQSVNAYIRKNPRNYSRYEEYKHDVSRELNVLAADAILQTKKLYDASLNVTHSESYRTEVILESYFPNFSRVRNWTKDHGHGQVDVSRAVFDFDPEAEKAKAILRRLVPQEKLLPRGGLIRPILRTTNDMPVMSKVDFTEWDRIRDRLGKYEKQDKFCYEIIKRVGCQYLPDNREAGTYSRGFFKAQQADIDLGVFENNTVLDLTSGSGGFTQYALCKWGTTSGMYVGNTLAISGHNVVSSSALTKYVDPKKFRFRMTQGKGDVRMVSTQEQFNNCLMGRKVRLVISDMGESYGNMQKTTGWLLADHQYVKQHEKDKPITKKGDNNILDAVIQTYTRHLERGGCLFIKMMGADENTEKIVQKLSEDFDMLQPWRSWSTPGVSLEWYLYCKRYRGDVIGVKKQPFNVKLLVRNVAHLLYHRNQEAVAYMQRCFKHLLADIKEHGKAGAGHGLSISSGKLALGDNKGHKRRFFVPMYHEPLLVPKDFGRSGINSANGLCSIYQVDAKGIRREFTDDEVLKFFVFPFQVEGDTKYCDPFDSNEKFSYNGEEFNTDIRSRCQRTLNTIRKRGIEEEPIDGVFQHLTVLNKFKMNLRGTKKDNPVGKHRRDKIFSDLSYNLWGHTYENSAVGTCQSDPANRVASLRKRLDYIPPEPVGIHKEMLSKSAKSIVTDEYRRIQRGPEDGKFTFWGWDDVVNNCNKKGSANFFDKRGVKTFRDWIALPSSREEFETCMSRICKGDSLGWREFCMPKEEKKYCKDIDPNGKITIPTDIRADSKAFELYVKSRTNLGHRAIQFAEIKLRAVALAIVGPMLFHHNYKKKLYLGSTTGTPLFRLGNVVRAFFDCYLPKENRDIDFEDDSNKGRYDAYIKSLDKKFLAHVSNSNSINAKKGRPLVSIGEMDYSSYDQTVTKSDHAEAYLFARDIYRKECHIGLKTYYAIHMMMPVLTPDGHLVLRVGQRGSGQQTTSFDNTKINSTHLYAAMAHCLNIPIEEATRVVGKIKALVTFEEGRPIWKEFNVTRISVVCDGDDVLLFGTPEDIALFKTNGIPFIEACGKKIRSGNESGIALHHKIKDANFCSHNFTRVRMGENINTMPYQDRFGCGGSEIVENGCYDQLMKRAGFFSSGNQETRMQALKKFEHSKGWRVAYVGERPAPKIFGKLAESSKLPNSLWEYETLSAISKDKDPGLSEADFQRAIHGMEISRGQCVSAMLNYPHKTPVILSCLAILSVLRDVPINIDCLKRGWEFKDLHGKLFSNAFKTVWRVPDINWVEREMSSVSGREMRTMVDNTKTCGFPTWTPKLGKVGAKTCYDLRDKILTWLHCLAMDYGIMIDYSIIQHYKMGLSGRETSSQQIILQNKTIQSEGLFDKLTKALHNLLWNHSRVIEQPEKKFSSGVHSRIVFCTSDGQLYDPAVRVDYEDNLKGKLRNSKLKLGDVVEYNHHNGIIYVCCLGRTLSSPVAKGDVYRTLSQVFGQLASKRSNAVITHKALGTKPISRGWLLRAYASLLEKYSVTIYIR